MDEPLGAIANFDPISSPAVHEIPTKNLSQSADSPRTYAECLWSAINANPRATLICVALLYLFIACAQAATKLLWGDELISLSIANQGSMHAIWGALAAGADPNPPLPHWLLLESTRAFGQGASAVRLPAILSVLLAIVSLWSILRRWVSPAYAAFGVLAFMATRGFDYAYDARSYAPLMGFAMASLALWQYSTRLQGWSRFAALVVMAATLAAGVSSNYYGVLAFFPIALGEAVRSTAPFSGAGRFEPGAWLAMITAALPLLAFQPLIRHNLAEFGPHAWNRAQPAMIATSYFELVEGVFWPVLALALYAAWKRGRSAPNSSTRPTAPLHRHECAALAVLLLYPILGYVIAAAGRGMISPRCVVPVCCGFGIAAALLASRIFGTRPRAGVILLGFALVWVVARESACAFVLAQQRTAFFALRDQVARQPASQPIVIADSLLVLPLAHYSSPAVRDRIVFPIDFEAIHAIEPDDSGEQNLWAGRNGVFPVRIVPYTPSVLADSELTLIARPTGWLAQNLTRDGFHLAEPASAAPWHNLGGVFTPLAHEDTRLLAARRF